MLVERDRLVGRGRGGTGRERRTLGLCIIERRFAIVDRRFDRVPQLPRPRPAVTTEPIVDSTVIDHSLARVEHHDLRAHRRSRLCAQLALHVDQHRKIDVQLLCVFHGLGRFARGVDGAKVDRSVFVLHRDPVQLGHVLPRGWAINLEKNEDKPARADVLENRLSFACRVSHGAVVEGQDRTRLARFDALDLPNDRIDRQTGKESKSDQPTDSPSSTSPAGAILRLKSARRPRGGMGRLLHRPIRSDRLHATSLSQVPLSPSFRLILTDFRIKV